MRVDPILRDTQKSIRQILRALGNNLSAAENFQPDGEEGYVLTAHGRQGVPPTWEPPSGDEEESVDLSNLNADNLKSGTVPQGRLASQYPDLIVDWTQLISVPLTFPPQAHASSHQNGSTDEISVAGLSGLLADAQTALAHAGTHQNGGADEISVAGLSGLLADAQTPTTHTHAEADITDGSILARVASTEAISGLWTFGNHLLFTDNSFDIGADGATRPRDLFLYRKLLVKGSTVPRIDLDGSACVVQLTDGTQTVQLGGGGGSNLVGTATAHSFVFMTNSLSRGNISSGGDWQLDGEIVRIGASAALARLRFRGFYASNPSDPPTNNADMFIVDDGVAPVLRVRYNDAGTVVSGDLLLV